MFAYLAIVVFGALRVKKCFMLNKNSKSAMVVITLLKFLKSVADF